MSKIQFQGKSNFQKEAGAARKQPHIYSMDNFQTYECKILFLFMPAVIFRHCPIQKTNREFPMES